MAKYTDDEINLLRKFCNEKCRSYYYQLYAEPREIILVHRPTFTSENLNYLFNKYCSVILTLCYLNVEYEKDLLDFSNDEIELIEKEDIDSILSFINLVEENNKIDLLDNEFFQFINSLQGSTRYDLYLIKCLLKLGSKEEHYCNFYQILWEERRVWLLTHTYQNTILLKLKAIALIREKNIEFEPAMLNCFVSYVYLNTDCDKDTLEKVVSMFKEYYYQYVELCDLNNINDINCFNDKIDAINFFENYFDSLIENNRVKQKKLGVRNERL